METVNNEFRHVLINQEIFYVSSDILSLKTQKFSKSSLINGHDLHDYIKLVGDKWENMFRWNDPLPNLLKYNKYTLKHAYTISYFYGTTQYCLIPPVLFPLIFFHLHPSLHLVFFFPFFLFSSLIILLPTLLASSVYYIVTVYFALGAHQIASAICSSGWDQFGVWVLW